MRAPQTLPLIALLAAALGCGVFSPAPQPLHAPLTETARLGRGMVRDAAFSADGNFLAIAASTGIGFYDAQTLAELHFEDTRRAVSQLAFSPDGQTLATAEDSIANAQHQIQLWTIAVDANGVTLTSIRVIPRSNFTDDLVFSPDGKYLAAADGQVRLWQVSDGRQIVSISTGMFAYHTSVAFSPDGALLASAGHGRSEASTPTRLWRVADLANGVKPDQAMPYELPGLFDTSLIAFAPDGQTFLTGNTVYQTSDGQVLITLPDSVKGASQTVFTPDGAFLLITDTNEGVAVLDAATGAEQHYFAPRHNARLALSSDGQTLVTTTDEAVQVWDLATLLDTDEDAAGRGALTSFSGYVYGVAFTPDGQSIVSKEYGLVRALSLTGDEQQRFPDVRSNLDVGYALSSDGQYLALRVTPPGEQPQVQIWQMRNHTLLHTLHTWGQLAFSPDGQLLAVGGDKRLQIWRTAEGELAQDCAGVTHRILQLAFSPDGQWVAADGIDYETVGVWRVTDGALQFQLGPHKAIISRLAFSPDGQWLAVGTAQQDANVRLWRMSDGTLQHTLGGHTQDITALVFSPDGQTLASGQGDYSGSPAPVRLWNVSDGKLLQTLNHPYRVQDAIFAADGQTLYVASGNNVYAWQVTDGALAYLLEGHLETVYSLALSPDGAQLASGATDGTVRLWTIR